MAELQLVVCNGYKGRLGSHDLGSRDEPITSSSLPMQMHPGHGNSPQLPSTLVTVPLIRVELTDIVHGAGSTRTSETATISDSHP